MAVSIYWPATLPQNVQKGYAETSGLSIIRTTMDSGVAKQRRRGSTPSVMSVSFLMTTAQVAVFENFVLNVIFGTYRFGFTHPRLQTQVEVRIVPQSGSQLYNITYVAPGYYNVDMQLEILP